MKVSRRKFIGFASAGMAALPLVSGLRSFGIGGPVIEAVAFDAFPIFDPRPIGMLAESTFPGKGAAVSAAWRTRQFEYQWLRALGGRYEDFMRTTEDALVFATKSLGIELTQDKREELMQGYRNLKVWPDVPDAIRALRATGLRLAFLSNMTERMLSDGIRQNGLTGLFEHVLSTDQIKTYKPDPKAYRMAVDAFNLERKKILFVSFAGWDTAGAKWFGYPTCWLNRLGAEPEELSGAADYIGRDLTDLAGYVSRGMVRQQ